MHFKKFKRHVQAIVFCGDTTSVGQTQHYIVSVRKKQQKFQKSGVHAHTRKCSEHVSFNEPEILPAANSLQRLKTPERINHVSTEPSLAKYTP